MKVKGPAVRVNNAARRTNRSSSTPSNLNSVMTHNESFEGSRAGSTGITPIVTSEARVPDVLAAQRQRATKPIIIDYNSFGNADYESEVRLGTGLRVTMPKHERVQSMTPGQRMILLRQNADTVASYGDLVSKEHPDYLYVRILMLQYRRRILKKYKVSTSDQWQNAENVRISQELDTLRKKLWHPRSAR